MTEPLPMSVLERWLERQVPGFEGPLSFGTFGVGQSNPTYRLRTPALDYVLRRKPAGHLVKSAHAVDREYQVISALHAAGFPVPRPIAFCGDDTLIGSIFYVMEMVEGRVLREGRLPGLSATERRATYEGLVDTLASLHMLEPDAIGLGNYGRPGNYYARQIDLWVGQYRATSDSLSASMEALIYRLPKAIPSVQRTTIVHGDFRLDNVVLAACQPKVRAVLDWELSTLGDPLGDLAFFLISWVAPMHLTPNQSGFADQNPASLGIPSIEQVVARYATARELPSIDGLEWRIAFNLFRLAAIYQGIVSRAAAGNATGQDALSYRERITPLAELAIDVLG